MFSICLTRFFPAAALLALALTARADWAAALLKNSPFLPAGAAASSAVAPQGPLELTGVVAVGNQTYVSIHDAQAKRSWWLPVGGGNAELSVISYNAQKDEAEIRVNGGMSQLTLRTARAIAAAPAFVAPGVPATGAAGTLTPVQQATEARMFVSDLLTIETRQRKAYEEAHKRQAANSAAQP